jgi:DNA-directed RNA polymerase subunit RPC12/RpoP
MTISFVCPQGHPLTAPDDMAGRAGKCPHCGTRFLIPKREAEAGPAVSGPAVSGPAVSGPAVSGPAVSGPAGARTDSIVFFCPNGHKLNGPATLRGKLGLCPHCQSRFRIPAEPEAGPAAEAPDSPPPGELVDDEGEVIEGRPLEERAEEAGDGGEPENTAADAEENATEATAAVPWQTPPPEAAESSRWLELTRWLWSQRDRGSTVELRLRSGVSLQPAWFSAALSDGRVGVFARQSEEGRYDISAIAWEQVDQVDIRGCEQLPPGLFE